MVWTPWEPAENLNREAPAGVSLVVTGCSQGPVGPLNSAGVETIAWNLSFHLSVPRRSSTASVHLDIYGFPLAERLLKQNLVHLAIDFDSGSRREHR